MKKVGEGVKMKNEKRLTRVCAYARERAQVMKRRVGREDEKMGRKVRKTARFESVVADFRGGRAR